LTSNSEFPKPEFESDGRGGVPALKMSFIIAFITKLNFLENWISWMPSIQQGRMENPKPVFLVIVKSAEN